MIGLEIELKLEGGLGRSLEVVRSKVALRGDDDDSKERGGSVNCGVSAGDDDEEVRGAVLCRKPSM